MKQGFKFRINHHISVNVDYMKMYVIQSKNGIVMNVRVNVKN